MLYVRLTRSLLKTVNVYRGTETTSAYIGTEITLASVGSIQANVQSAENRLNAEIYGEKVKDMKTLYCEIGANVLLGDTVEIDGVRYKIISLKPYNTHITIIGELI